MNTTIPHHVYSIAALAAAVADAAHVGVAVKMEVDIRAQLDDEQYAAFSSALTAIRQERMAASLPTGCSQLDKQGLPVGTLTAF